MRHSRLTVLGIAVAVVLVGATAAVMAAPDALAPSSESRTVGVGASGQVSAEPNQVVLRVTTVGRGEDVSTARQRLEQNTSAMQQALDSLELSDDQIQTVAYRIDEDRRKETEGTSYRAIHAFEITLENTDQAGEVIDSVVANGDAQVHDVEFGLTREKRQQLRKQALTKAVSNARDQAGVLAEKAGLRITGAQAVRTGSVEFDPYRTRAYTTAESAGAGGTSIQSGPVDVTVTVQVTYRAVDA